MRGNTLSGEMPDTNVFPADNSKTLCLLLVFFILAPKIGVLDFSVLFLMIAWVIFSRSFNYSSESKLLLSLFATIFLINLISCALNSRFNTDILLKPIRLILIILFLYPTLVKQKASSGLIIDSIIFAGALNSIAVLAQVVLGLTGVGDEYLRFYPAGETENAMRKPGLSSGFPSSGVLSGISAVASLIVFYFKKKNRYLILALLCYPGVFMSARTAVILFLGSSLIFVFVALSSVKLGFLFKWLGLTGGLVYFTSILISNSEELFDLFYVMFEFFFAYENSGSIGVRSTDDLMENHYFFPKNIYEWVFGNSMSAWEPGGIESDVWFVQNLIGAGVFSTLLYLISFFILYFFSNRNKDRSHRVVSLVVFSFVFISSFKASFIFSRFVGDVATLIGVLGLVYFKKSQPRRIFVKL